MTPAAAAILAYVVALVFVAGVLVAVSWRAPKAETYQLPSGTTVECLSWAAGTRRACWDPEHQPVTWTQ